MHTIKYTRYPNNEIRVTHYNSVPRREKQPPIEKTEGAFSCPGTASDLDGECVSDDLTPLDISSKVDHPGGDMPHRRTKFGLNAKRTLLRLGGAYDTIDPVPQHYVFLTGTIPGGTHDAFMAMARESRYVVHAIAKWLSRTTKTPHWFYVWELQRRGALHIHYCVYSPDTSAREKILREWHSKWHALIQEVGCRSSTDMWLRKDGTYHKEGHSVLQAYAQEVRKSVAAYLAGYCGGAKDKHSSDSTSPYYPGRWWGCSRESTRLLKSLTDTREAVYSDYRGARKQIQLDYEAICHDTPLSRHYPHKVGIGSTIVSFHPEDKGSEIWQQLTMSIHNPSQYPNASSWILALHTYIQTWVVYCKALKKHKGHALERLLQDCEDITSQGSLQRYTLHQSTLRTVRRTVSECSLNTIAQSNRALTMSALVPPIWMLSQVERHLKWNGHGWLSLQRDFDVRLTDCWSVCDIGTNDPERSDAVPEGVNGSLSAPPPPSIEQLCLFLDSSVSQPRP